MKSDPTFADIRFEAPGPGPWELERTHFARLSSRFGAEATTRGIPRGFSESSAHSGVLLSHVTDRGGQLSHAAIVAREYGIPGVVGTKEATAKIPDGARVRVDGGAGEVTILPRGSGGPAARGDSQEQRAIPRG